LYILSTLAPNTTTASTVYVYNTITSAWTNWDTIFSKAIIGPNNTPFMISSDLTIKQERRNQNKIDYCDQDFPSTIVSVSSDKMSAVVNTSVVAVAAGDVFVQANIISRVASVASIAGSTNLLITFHATVNFAAADTPTFYKAYKSIIKFAPITGGDVGKNKHFAILTGHFRNQSCSKLTLYFANDKFGSSGSIDWLTSQISGGWGNEPWGLFAWGDTEGIDLQYQTLPTVPLRIYIPRFAARGTFIQPVLEHNEAAEQINLQTVDISTRGYGERVSK